MLSLMTYDPEAQAMLWNLTWASNQRQEEIWSLLKIFWLIHVLHCDWRVEQKYWIDYGITVENPFLVLLWFDHKIQWISLDLQCDTPFSAALWYCNALIKFNIKMGEISWLPSIWWYVGDLFNLCEKLILCVSQKFEKKNFSQNPPVLIICFVPLSNPVIPCGRDLREESCD